MNTGRQNPEGAGTQTAALGFGGYVGGASALTEEYNGTSWSASNNMGTARYSLAGGGTQTAAIAFGGDPGRKADTELYDGTSWTTTTNLTNGRSALGAANAAPNSASLAFGGRTGTVAVVLTEEFTGLTEPVRSFDVS